MASDDIRQNRDFIGRVKPRLHRHHSGLLIVGDAGQRAVRIPYWQCPHCEKRFNNFDSEHLDECSDGGKR